MLLKQGKMMEKSNNTSGNECQGYLSIYHNAFLSLLLSSEIVTLLLFRLSAQFYANLLIRRSRVKSVLENVQNDWLYHTDNCP